MRLISVLLKAQPRPVPNMTRASLWQDPIFGYFETHGKMEFKPGEEYDLTESEKKAVMERYIKKEQLKRQYLELEYNPLRYQYTEGIIMDPAMFRWYATDMSHLERFRGIPKTIFIVFGGIIAFFWLLHRTSVRPTQEYDALSRQGKYLWWDRNYRSCYMSGEGELTIGTT